MAEGDAARAAAAREWRLLEETARDVLACRDIRRLYPANHDRVSRAAARVVASVRFYETETGRPFSVRPENILGLDNLTGAGSRIEELAILIHTSGLRSLTLHPSLSVEAIKELLGALDRPGDAQPPAGLPGVDLDVATNGELEGYLFNAEGEQLFTSREEGGARLQGLPPALSRGLSSAFADPDTRARAERIFERMRGDGAVEDGASVNLIEEWVKLLFPDPARAVDRSPEEVSRYVRDFVRMVEDAAPHLGEGGAVPGSEALQSWLRNIMGAGDWNRPGLPSELRAEKTLRRTLIAEEGADEGCEIGLDDVGSLFGDGGGDEGERRRRALPDAAIRDELPPSLLRLTELDCDPDQLAAEVAAVDFDLMALRIEAERLAVSEGAVLEPRRRRYLRRLSAYPWDGPREYLAELGEAAAGIDSEEGALDLYIDALATHTSQEVVDTFFAERLEDGSSLEELRPVLQGVARRSGPTCLGVLARLWQRSERELRGDCLTEIFSLELDAADVCAWGDRNPQIARSPEFFRRLESIEIGRLLSTCRSGLGDAVASVGPTARALLRIATRRAGGGPVIAAALRHPDRGIRRDVLRTITACRDRAVFLSLEALIDANNQRSNPDLEEVHLALRALLRSPLPLAEEFLRRIRSERALLLRHVYRAEIRGMLELLERAGSIAP